MLTKLLVEPVGFKEAFPRVDTGIGDAEGEALACDTSVSYQSTWLEFCLLHCQCGLASC